MATFLLVHGAWHGGWCWREVAGLLRGRGHEVHTPTLTGLCERRHLIDCVEGPDTHVDDVVNLAVWEDLGAIVLVGHSYGGLVVAGAAGRMPERVRRLVYLDAFVPEASGQATTPMSDPRRAAEIAAARRPDGHIEPTGFDLWTSDPGTRALLERRTTAQPGPCLERGVTLTGAEREVAVKDYILCARNPRPHFKRLHDAYTGAPGWRTFELPCLHDAMLEMPEGLAGILGDDP